jgi:hypothetical protein
VLDSLQSTNNFLKLTMLTEIQRIEMPLHFLKLFEDGKADDALLYLRENWLIYPHLPDWSRDKEQISEIAVSQHLSMSRNMSQRLQRDIRFFEKVFNQHSPYAKIALETGRDTFFMLAYANAAFFYTKAATKSDVADFFPIQDIELEFSIAQQLISETNKWRDWHLSDKQECSLQLATMFPGFANLRVCLLLGFMVRKPARSICVTTSDFSCFSDW